MDLSWVHEGPIKLTACMVSLWNNGMCCMFIWNNYMHCMYKWNDGIHYVWMHVCRYVCEAMIYVVCSCETMVCAVCTCETIVYVICAGETLYAHVEGWWAICTYKKWYTLYIHAKQWYKLYVQVKQWYTVKPLTSSHPKCWSKVASQKGWPVIRGSQECRPKNSLIKAGIFTLMGIWLYVKLS